MLVGTAHWVRTSSVNWDKHKFNCMRQNEKFGVSRQIELPVLFQVDLKLYPLSDCQVVYVVVIPRRSEHWQLKSGSCVQF